MTTQGTHCANCAKWTEGVIDEQGKEDASWGWCRNDGGPGIWLGWKKHKVKGDVGWETHATGCCEDHEDRPCKPSSSPSD